MLSSLTLVVIMIVVVGLVIVANGYTKFTEHKKAEISKCGGIILLMLANCYINCEVKASIL